MYFIVHLDGRPNKIQYYGHNDVYLNYKEVLRNPGFCKSFLLVAHELHVRILNDNLFAQSSLSTHAPVITVNQDIAAKRTCSLCTSELYKQATL